jgi:hypothetical protein|tara:strand:- start:1536 stop:1823 length:288 start_codon:yes stop_codon:yes gene_type:complete
MATFSTLDECERCAAILLQLNVRYKQKIRRKKNVEKPYAVILLDNVDLLLAQTEVSEQCPHCGTQTTDYKWCKHCGDITSLDEYEAHANKMGWHG